jgi:hypothetical protein
MPPPEIELDREGVIAKLKLLPYMICHQAFWECNIVVVLLIDGARVFLRTRTVNAFLMWDGSMDGVIRLSVHTSCVGKIL